MFLLKMQFSWGRVKNCRGMTEFGKVLCKAEFEMNVEKSKAMVFEGVMNILPGVSKTATTVEYGAFRKNGRLVRGRASETGEDGCTSTVLKAVVEKQQYEHGDEKSLHKNIVVPMLMYGSET